MSSDAPGPATPGWGQPPQAGTPETPASGGWPAELVPPPATEAEADTAPVPAAPAAPVAPVAPVAPTAPAAPGATGWGDASAPVPPAPRPEPPATTQWGTPAPQPAAPAVQQAPQWGAGAAPPPAAGGWGAQGQPPAQAAPQWGAPPQQSGAWGPPPGVPGAPPSGAWNPEPAKSGNGCLKGCLIVGGILVVLAILAVIAISVIGLKFAEDLGVNPDGSTKACKLISSEELTQVLGSDAQALPMGGIADATIGQVLDKRALADAPDCWVLGATQGAVTGRLARRDGGDTSGDFRTAMDTAKSEGWFDGDVSGVGDEAFCTGVSEFGAAGVLVRSGGSLVYVSLIDPATLDGTESPQHACDLAAEIAVRMLR